MKKLLSVYFGENRTYFAITEPAKKGFELKYVHFDKFTPNLQDADFSDMSQNFDFTDSVREIMETADAICIVLPDYITHSTLIPKPVELNTENLKKLCELEIRLNYPDKVYEDFSASIVPLKNSKNNEDYVLAEIVLNSVIEKCKILLSSLKIPIEKIVTSSIASLSSYFYNYPEIQKQTTAIISIGDNSFNFSVCKNSNPLFHSQIKETSNISLFEFLENELYKVIDLFPEKIQYLLISGEAYTQEIVDELRNHFVNKGISINRFNSFRMLTTNLNNDYREYCSRMAHVFPPCIGAGLPEFVKEIKVF